MALVMTKPIRIRLESEHAQRVEKVVAQCVKRGVKISANTVGNLAVRHGIHKAEKELNTK
jgi:hypothetical protein